MTPALPPPVAFELRDVAASDVYEAIRRGSRLISPRVGLIRRIDETRYLAQDPVVFCTGVVAADFARCLENGQAVKAGGAGPNAAVAVATAIAETVERHCTCFYDPDLLVEGSARELAPLAVSPELLRFFTREQLEHFGKGAPAHFDDDTRLRWAWGYSLTRRTPRLVPASRVYMNYRPLPGEARIGHSASTGLAAGLTREEAILSALLELVERDAVTIAWLQGWAGRRIDVDDLDTAASLRTRAWTDRRSVDVRAFELATDLDIPAVLLVMRRQTEIGPVACVGSAARLSARQALLKSMHEAAQNFPYLRYVLEGEKHWQPAPDFSNLETFDHHFLTYLKRPELVPQGFAFLDRCPLRVPLSQIPDGSTGRVLGDLECCLARIEKAGYEVIACDLTTPDVAEVGFSVVRVVIPGLMPLHSHHRRPHLGVRRLFELPARLNWHRAGWDPMAGLNPLPHPFP